MPPSPTTSPAKVIGVISFMNAAGAQEAIVRLAGQLRRRGYSAEVWFIYEETPAYRGQIGVRTLFAKHRLSILEYVRAFVALVRQLRQEKPDAVIGFLPLGNVFGLSAALLAGIRVRVASQRAPASTFGRIMRQVDRIIGSIGIYTSIVCVSHAVKRSFAGYPRSYSKRISVVHNGIDWHSIDLDKQAARSALHLPCDQFLYVALGRMKRQKNYSFLLDAFALVGSGVLAIAGDGELRLEIEDQIARLGLARRVVLLGNLNRREAQTLLRAADVFVQSSFYEGQSNAVLEAMHEGLPIVVSDIPEQRETLIEPHSGIVAGCLEPLGDPYKWAATFELLQKSPDLRAQLSARARQWVEREFALDRMTDGFVRVLRNEPKQ